jgi:hypothetical protein
VQNTFFQQRLFTHHFACLMRAGHPLYSERLSLDAFLEMEHAVVRAEGRSQELFESLLERRRIRRKIVLYTPHFLSIPMADAPEVAKTKRRRTSVAVFACVAASRIFLRAATAICMASIRL